ncbi:MAG: CPBP family intramembrane metalloprotease [bacterium]|nr:CPBP family intramembrane metalloprotease [bacterium]
MSTERGSIWGRCWLWIECVLIYGVLPLVFAHPWMRYAKVPALYGLLVLAMWLARCTWGTWRPLLEVGTLRSCVSSFVWRGLLAAVVIAAATWWLGPEYFLRFPRSRPVMWALVMLLYPGLSAYPQELIYRTCFFARYAVIFPTPLAMVVASSVAFGWLHVVFGNVPAVVLSFLAGIMLSHTYLRTRSTLAVSVEHALYGCLVFTIGLGRYFYLPL